MSAARAPGAFRCPQAMPHRCFAPQGIGKCGNGRGFGGRFGLGAGAWERFVGALGATGFGFLTGAFAATAAAGP